MRTWPIYLIAVAGLLECASDQALTSIPDPVATDEIAVRDNNFNPAHVSITAGTTVTWTWTGRSQHNVVFEDGAGSSALQTSGTLARTFAAPGTYRFRCTPHSNGFGSGMIGQVTVQ